MKSNKNGVKLLAAVMALAMVLVAGFVIIDDNEVSAADVTTLSDITSGTGANVSTSNLNADKTITIAAKNLSSDTLKFTAATGSNVTFTINFQATSGSKIMFTGGTIDVGAGVKLVLNMTAESALDHCHILKDTALTIANGGEVVFKQSVNTQGQSWWNQSNKTLDLDGTLTFDGANGISGVAANLASTARIDIKSTTSTAANGAAINFATYTDNANAKITVSDEKVWPYFASQSTIAGEIDAKNSKVVFAAGSSTVTGTITASTVECRSTATVVAGVNGNIAADYSATTISNAATLLGTNGISEVTVTGTQTLTGNIYVPANKTLILDGATVQNTENNAFIIIVDGELQSNAAYIYCGVYINENGTFTGINTHSNTMTGTMVDDYKVGFGDKLVLTGTIPAGVTLDAYGAVTLNDATVAGTVKTYVGSTMDIQGTVTVSSAFTINAGAEIELTGTITVKNDANGGASLTLAEKETISSYDGTSGNDLDLISKLTIAEGGVLKVNKPTSNAATSTNSLIVGSDAQLVVEGTLDITGTLSGTVQDKGTVLFNGTAAAAGATIVLYDGVSITVGSVTGTLTISDLITDTNNTRGIIADIDPSAVVERIVDGNQVILTNVKNVTVSENVTSKVNKANDKKFYFCNMSVSGAVTKVNGVTGTATLEITATSDKADIENNSKYTYAEMNIVDTLTIGKNVAVTISNKVTLKGSMSSMEDTDHGTIAVPGTLTVSGQLFGKAGTISYTGTINAVYYTITTVSEGTSSTVYYYTGFAQAANAIGDADEDTITVLGSVSMSADAEIAPQMTVAVPGTLTIKDGYTLTIDDGALLSVTGQVTVSGTLVIVNSDTGLTIGKLAYDTSRVNGKTVTYTNLANALAGAVEGDIITLAQGVSLSKAVTIPAGVTVQTGKYTVTMKDGSSLKVDGTFAVQNGGSVVLGTADPTLVWGKNAKITVNGVMTSTTSTYTYATYKISGAYFTLKGVNYITNLAYAAGAVDEGSVSIYGDVAAGDVTFTKKENVTNLIITAESASNVSVSSMTLDGAKLVATGKVTGAIKADAEGSVAEIVLSKASGVNIESTTRAVGTDSVDCLTIDGTIVGKITVSEGTARISTTTSVTGNDNLLAVSSGATLDVVGTTTIGAVADKYATLSVEGTLNVIGTVQIVGIANVSGTVNIEKENGTGNAQLFDDGKLNITGTVNVSADEDNGGTFLVGSTTATGATASATTGYVTLGEKPTQIGASGAIVGKVTLAGDSFMKVYGGASVEDAKINWNDSTEESDAVNTVFYINGTPYVTAYAASSNQVKLVETNSVIASDWVNENVGLGITGIVTKDANNLDKWFSDEALTAPVTANKIGGTEKIYFDAPISTASIIASVGSGMSLWIDGVKYASGEGVDLTVGTHDVSVTVNPGYAGTPAITFNGQTVSNGKITVTTDMVGERNILSVNGEITIAGGNSGSSSSDDGMGITDYLLIVLVVLAAILVVIVAIRMMRS